MKVDAWVPFMSAIATGLLGLLVVMWQGRSAPYAALAERVTNLEKKVVDLEATNAALAQDNQALRSDRRSLINAVLRLLSWDGTPPPPVLGMDVERLLEDHS